MSAPFDIDMENEISFWPHGRAREVISQYHNYQKKTDNNDNNGQTITAVELVIYFDISPMSFVFYSENKTLDSSASRLGP